MKIKSIASGSSGNCYIVSDSSSKLMIECGVKIQKIKEAIDFDFNSISGCLITHEHGDHANCHKKLSEFYGVDIFTAKETGESLELKRFKPVQVKKWYRIDSFDVMPFDVKHDAVNPLGFYIISRATGESLLFATDTYLIKYKFKNLDYIMIEANYDLNILNQNVESGRVNRIIRNRVIKSHMSIDNAIDYLSKIDKSNLKKVYLIHLSNDNSNEKEFIKRVRHEVFVPCEAF